MNPTKERFDELSKGKFGLISEPYIISDKVIYSWNYLENAGVVILGKKWAGIFNSWRGDNKGIGTLVDMLSKKESNLKSFVIAGADNYADNMVEKLIEMNLPVDEYRDHYMIEAVFNKDTYRVECRLTPELKEYRDPLLWRKEILVNPPTQEVFVYSEMFGCSQLSPTKISPSRFN